MEIADWTDPPAEQGMGAANGTLARFSAERLRPAGMLGESSEMRRLLSLAAIAANDSEPLLLFGESGTGKDILARAIHDASPNASQPFVTLNAAAKPADLLDRELLGPAATQGERYPQVPRHLMLSMGGTLYLDDICRIPLETQIRLLDFLRNPRIVTPDGRDKAWSGRIISATNIDPRQAIREGKFRRDLYDHLAVGYLYLPPLRQRPEDIAEIASKMYPQVLADFGLPTRELSSRLIAQLAALPWPGNTRELMNALRRMALTPEAARGELPDLPADFRVEPSGVGAAVETLTFDEIERRAILSALDRHDGSVPRASEELRLAASTIYRKLKSWNL